MSSACMRSMSLGQNIHMLPQNCIMMPNGAVQQVMQNNNKPIAPAPLSNQTQTSATSVLGMNGSNIKQAGTNGSNYKKKYTYNNMPYGDQPPSVVRRNARERNRVKQVNNGFVNLRQHIPQTIVSSLSSGGRGASKKLSKVDTLRMAVEYIRRLQDIIEESDSDTGSTSTYSQSSTAGSPPPLSYYENNSDQYNIQNSYSDASVSPTPSYSSDLSNNYLQNSPPHPQFKFEPYDSYAMMPDTPDDEEILDYISSWQEQ